MKEQVKRSRAGHKEKSVRLYVQGTSLQDENTKIGEASTEAPSETHRLKALFVFY